MATVTRTAPLLRQCRLSSYSRRLYSSSYRSRPSLSPSPTLSQTSSTTTTTSTLTSTSTSQSTSRFLPTKRSLSSTSTATPIFAENTNQAQLSAPLHSLLEEKQWTLDEECMGIAKTYYFKTYTKCLDFTQVVGIRSKSKNHHSIITVKSGSVHIHWTTHFPRGITEMDIDMAQYCDQQAALIGTVQRVDANKCRPDTKS